METGISRTARAEPAGALYEAPWERWRLAGKIEQGAGFAGEDASAPRFIAPIHVQVLEVLSFHEPPDNNLEEKPDLHENL